MIDELKGYSVVPTRFRNTDPRALLYHYPSMPAVKYAKIMQRYSHMQALSVSEDLANRQGYVLLPSTCMHWQRVKKLGPERRVKVGSKSFYLMRLYELTKTEVVKVKNYIEEINEKKYGY